MSDSSVAFQSLTPFQCDPSWDTEDQWEDLEAIGEEVVAIRNDCDGKTEPLPLPSAPPPSSLLPIAAAHSSIVRCHATDSKDRLHTLSTLKVFGEQNTDTASPDFEPETEVHKEEDASAGLVPSKDKGHSTNLPGESLSLSPSTKDDSEESSDPELTCAQRAQHPETSQVARHHDDPSPTLDEFGPTHPPPATAVIEDRNIEVSQFLEAELVQRQQSNAKTLQTDTHSPQTNPDAAASVLPSASAELAVPFDVDDAVFQVMTNETHPCEESVAEKEKKALPTECIPDLCGSMGTSDGSDDNGRSNPAALDRSLQLDFAEAEPVVFNLTTPSSCASSSSWEPLLVPAVVDHTDSNQASKELNTSDESLFIRTVTHLNWAKFLVHLGSEVINSDPYLRLAIASFFTGVLLFLMYPFFWLLQYPKILTPCLVLLSSFIYVHKRELHEWACSSFQSFNGVEYLLDVCKNINSARIRTFAGFFLMLPTMLEMSTVIFLVGVVGSECTMFAMICLVIFSFSSLFCIRWHWEASPRECCVKALLLLYSAALLATLTLHEKERKLWLVPQFFMATSVLLLSADPQPVSERLSRPLRNAVHLSLSEFCNGLGRQIRMDDMIQVVMGRWVVDNWSTAQIPSTRSSKHSSAQENAQSCSGIQWEDLLPTLSSTVDKLVAEAKERNAEEPYRVLLNQFQGMLSDMDLDEGLQPAIDTYREMIDAIPPSRTFAGLFAVFSRCTAFLVVLLQLGWFHQVPLAPFILLAPILWFEVVRVFEWLECINASVEHLADEIDDDLSHALECCDPMVILLSDDLYDREHPPSLLIAWGNTAKSAIGLQAGVSAFRCVQTSSAIVGLTRNIASLTEFGNEISEKGWLGSAAVVLSELLLLHHSGANKPKYANAACEAWRHGTRMQKNVDFFMPGVSPAWKALPVLVGAGWLWNVEKANAAGRKTSLPPLEEELEIVFEQDSGIMESDDEEEQSSHALVYDKNDALGNTLQEGGSVLFHQEDEAGRVLLGMAAIGVAAFGAAAFEIQRNRAVDNGPRDFHVDVLEEGDEDFDDIALNLALTTEDEKSPAFIPGMEGPIPQEELLDETSAVERNVFCTSEETASQGGKEASAVEPEPRVNTEGESMVATTIQAKDNVTLVEMDGIFPLEIGTQVWVKRMGQPKLEAIVAYLGPVDFGKHAKTDLGDIRMAWIGVELIGLDARMGKHNGTVEGRTYFATKLPRAGLFVRRHNLLPRHDKRSTPEQRAALKEFEEKVQNIKLPPDDKIHSLFDEIDTNGYGSLSMKEIEKAMIKRKFDLKPTILLHAFETADSDSDGQIGREDFFKFIRSISYYKNLYNVFSLIDKEGNRHLSKEQFITAATHLKVPHPEQVVEELDEKRGYVCFDEFCLYMTDLNANPP